MDMNKAFFLKKEDRDPKWHLIDAKGKVIGRLATRIADVLRGKDRATYTPHTDSGDYVVVINADKAVFTGAKMKNKEYTRVSGYIGGKKVQTAKEAAVRDHEFLIMHAVRGMMDPQKKMTRAQLKKLKIYAGEEHPHKAQVA